MALHTVEDVTDNVISESQTKRERIKSIGKVLTREKEREGDYGIFSGMIEERLNKIAEIFTLPSKHLLRQMSTIS